MKLLLKMMSFRSKMVDVLLKLMDLVYIMVAGGTADAEPGDDGSIRAMTWQPMINCPGPYSYDGRDKGRRAGITQPQRALVTCE